MLKKNLCVVYHNPPSKDWFSKSIDALAKSYKFISAEQLENFYNGKTDLKNCCHITFDDGYQSVFDYAYPVLKEKGIPATLFVSPKIIEQQENFWFQIIEQIPNVEFEKIAPQYFQRYKELNLKKYGVFSLLKTTSLETIEQITQQLKKNNNYLKNLNMAIDNLSELKSSGIFEIGAHTMNHPILKNETDEKANFEITESIRRLGDLLCQEIKYFAYPNGIPQFDFSEREFKILKKNKIKLSFTTEHTFLKRSDHKYAVPRINIANGGVIKILIKSIILPYFQELLINFNSSSEKNERKDLQKLLLKN